MPTQSTQSLETFFRITLAGLACGLAVVVGFGLRPWLDAPNLVMLFLLAVVVVAR